MSLKGLWLSALLLAAAFPIAGQKTEETRGERASYVRMFQFSPDGKTVVSYTFDDALLSWDLESRKLLRSQQAKADHPTFDPLGNLLTVESAGEGIRLLDVVRNQEVKFIKVADFAGYLYKVALSPDGKTLASTEGNYIDVIKLWDVTTGKENATIKRPNPDHALNTMLFSNDGAALAELGRSVTLWSAATGKKLSEVKIDAGLARMAFAPDGKMICVSGFDNRNPPFIKCFGALSGREVLSVPADPSAPFAFSPDGKFLALVRRDQGIILVNTATGKEIGKLTISANLDSLTQMSFSPNGKLLAVAAMEGLVLLDHENRKELFILAK